MRIVQCKIKSHGRIKEIFVIAKTTNAEYKSLQIKKIYDGTCN